RSFTRIRRHPRCTLFPYTTFFRSRNVQPYVKRWYERYGPEEFVVVGVHTPELAFERDLDNLRAAIDRDREGDPGSLDGRSEVVRSAEHTTELQSRIEPV